MSDPYSRRALRRHHRSRVVAKARVVTRRWYSSYDQDWRDPLSVPSHAKADARAVKYADHLKVCSCLSYGCGNPRRGGVDVPSLTRPELRQVQELQEELAEVFSPNPLDSDSEPE